MRSTGKRHAFQYDYDVGFDDDGRILGLDITLASRCGFSADLSGPVNDRAVFHVDNCYWLPNIAIHSYRCKTHTVSDTAFRGFGGPQGMFAIESVIDDIARHLRCDPLDVRKRNLYGTHDRNQAPYGMLWAAIPAWLRTRFNANEILTSLMLVYVATLFLSWLVHGPWRDPEGYNFPQSKLFVDSALLPILVAETRLNAAILIALAITAVAWLFVRRHIIGFEMRVAGSSRSCAIDRRASPVSP